MKAIGFEVEEMMKLFLVIIIGLGVVILIIGASGGISTLLTEFCAKNPNICGSQDQNQQANYATAKASVDSLVCAINSVGKEQDMCAKYSMAALSSSGVSGFALGTATTNPGVKCDKKESKTTTVDAKSYWLSTSQLEDENKANPNKYFDCQNSDMNEMGGTMLKGATCYSCTDGVRIGNTRQCKVVLEYSYQCTVSNFQLPQKVTTISDWIIRFGDPQFLAYWQNFPMEQDTWSFKTDWRLSALIMLVSYLPPTKVAGAVAKAEFRGLTKMTANEFRDKAIEKLQQIATERFTKSPQKVVIKGITLEGAALAAEYVSSTKAKYEPNQNTLILKSPYENKETFSLINEWKGKPVLIQWKPDSISFTRTENAHLISPCKIDSMTVEKAKVRCNEYVFNSNTGVVSCNEWVKDEGGIVKYLSDFFATGEEATCDITSYINLPLVNDMDRIKKMSADELIKNFIGTGYVVKECPENTLNIDYSKAVDYLNDYKIPIKLGNDYSYFASACYSSNNMKADRIEIGYGDKTEILMDSDFDGSFESYSLKNCKTDAVIIKDVKKSSTKNDYNYCFDERGGYQKTLEYGGAIVGTGSLIAAGYFTGGTAWLFLLGGSLAGVGLETAGMYEERVGSWPGKLGG